ncbi:hypothetical protein DFP72DRAFT_829537 [Ephemerocybe angulata]|uniref:Uncharacterized protein n=1 Tax=Ephemerocybe angulata TaxID=980116 RepID=A0A8H6H9A4_9AGAR|nr:hypothetical protein DFP72DRAFT_829537 [Tulosesus angulatus]
MSISLDKVVCALKEYPHLYERVALQDLLHFVNLCTLVKPYLKLAQSPYTQAPLPTQPRYIHDFLAASLGLKDDVVKLLWWALKEVIWEGDLDEAAERELASGYIAHFLKEGHPRDIGT